MRPGVLAPAHDGGGLATDFGSVRAALDEAEPMVCSGDYAEKGLRSS